MAAKSATAKKNKQIEKLAQGETLISSVASELGWSVEKTLAAFMAFISDEKAKEVVEVPVQSVEPAKQNNEETAARKSFARREGVTMMTPAASEMGDEAVKANQRGVNRKNEAAIYRGNGTPNFPDSPAAQRRF